MSVVKAQERCWELSHYPGSDRESWPHFSTVEEAGLELWRERKEAVRWAHNVGATFRDECSELVDAHPVQLDEPCCHLVCDGCGQALGHEGEIVDQASAMHMAPDEVDAWVEAEVRNTDWQELSNGDHRCGGDDCWVTEDDDEDDDEATVVDPEVEARRPGPNDVPLPFPEETP